jgi:hypothetical protein
MVAPKKLENFEIWNESYMVNFKPISNTLKMDFQKGPWFANFGPF